MFLSLSKILEKSRRGKKNKKYQEREDQERMIDTFLEGEI
jgi:hypothetical protein